MENLKENISINIDYFKKLSDADLLKVEKHWRNQAESTQLVLNRATVTLDVIESVKQSRQNDSATRLEELKATTGNDYTGLVESV